MVDNFFAELLSLAITEARESQCEQESADLSVERFVSSCWFLRNLVQNNLDGDFAKKGFRALDQHSVASLARFTSEDLYGLFSQDDVIFTASTYLVLTVDDILNLYHLFNEADDCFASESFLLRDVGSSFEDIYQAYLIACCVEMREDPFRTSSRELRLALIEKLIKDASDDTEKYLRKNFASKLAANGLYETFGETAEVTYQIKDRCITFRCHDYSSTANGIAAQSFTDFLGVEYLRSKSLLPLKGQDLYAANAAPLVFDISEIVDPSLISVEVLSDITPEDVSAHAFVDDILKFYRMHYAAALSLKPAIFSFEAHYTLHLTAICEAVKSLTALSS